MRKTLDGITYNWIDPTGNITILVESDVSQEDHAVVAKQLMDHDSSCQQVGFVGQSDFADIKLSMAAGEFCGNATMSAAVLFCTNTGLACNESRSVTVESSGAKDPVKVDITCREDGRGTYYTGSVNMPRPRRIRSMGLPIKDRQYDLPVVEFDGITHIIVSSQELKLDPEETVRVLKEWWELIRSSCLGIMTIDEYVSDGNSNVSVTVRPLVYAPDVETCYWESSCASGTTALAAYYRQYHDIPGLCLTAKEPGGTLTVACRKDGALLLQGSVRL